MKVLGDFVKGSFRPSLGVDGNLLWVMFFSEVTVLKNIRTTLRLGAQSSYVVKYFEGSNAVKTTSKGN